MVHFNVNEVLASGITDLNCMKIADDMIASIMYDSGMVITGIGIFEEHPIYYVRKIAVAVKNFLIKNPETIITEFDLEEICNGEYSQVIQNYSCMNGFLELHLELNKFYNLE